MDDFLGDDYEFSREPETEVSEYEASIDKIYHLTTSTLEMFGQPVTIPADQVISGNISDEVTHVVFLASPKVPLEDGFIGIAQARRLENGGVMLEDTDDAFVVTRWDEDGETVLFEFIVSWDEIIDTENDLSVHEDNIEELLFEVLEQFDWLIKTAQLTEPEIDIDAFPAYITHTLSDGTMLTLPNANFFEGDFFTDPSHLN